MQYLLEPLTPLDRLPAADRDVLQVARLSVRDLAAELVGQRDVARAVAAKFTCNCVAGFDGHPPGQVEQHAENCLYREQMAQEADEQAVDRIRQRFEQAISRETALSSTPLLLTSDESRGIAMPRDAEDEEEPERWDGLS